MQQLVILFVINCSSTCFGRLYAHHQEVRLRKDARNMLRNNRLPIKSLTVASSWSHLYLLIKDARSFEYKVIYSYSRSHQYALFLNFILIYNSTCFGHTYCPSSGVLILYSQQRVFVILVMLTVC